MASLTGDGAYDWADVYRAVAERHPEAAVGGPPRRDAVPSEAAETAPTRRDRHLRSIAEQGHLGGRGAPATTAVLRPRRRSPALSGWSATRCARAPTRAGRPRSPSASTS